METNKDNNLSVSMENYKGTRAYDSFTNNNLSKGFSEEPDEVEGKEPTPKDVHKNEMEQNALKKAEAAKNDKKFSYKSLSDEEKRAMKILCNIENKTAREKIEDVMDHLGVSKMGAINILADATKEVAAGKSKVEGKEAKSEPKEEKKAIEKGEGNSLEKALNRLDDYLEKAKYTKRTGTPGNYRYEYADDKKGNSGKDSGGEKGTFSTGGSTYNTRMFRSKDAANKFMSENKGHGVIGEYGNIIHVAKNSDKGTPNPKPAKTQNAELENITNAMNRLEEQIQREQKYIKDHGEFNDSGEYDHQWEEYKRDAQFNLDKWDDMKKERDEIKARSTKGSESVTYSLNDQEIKEQKQVIDKYERLIEKELSMGDLADSKNIEQYKKQIETAKGPIKNGIVFDDEFMVNQLKDKSIDDDNDLEKGAGHKYYKREGTPGNYKYYYSEKEYKQKKMAETSDKRTKITKENLSSDKVKEGLKNKFGMDFENSPEVREALKKEVGNTLDKIRFESAKDDIKYAWENPLDRGSEFANRNFKLEGHWVDQVDPRTMKYINSVWDKMGGSKIDAAVAIMKAGSYESLKKKFKKED